MGERIDLAPCPSNEWLHDKVIHKISQQLYTRRVEFVRTESVAHKSSTRAIVRPRIPKWTRYMRRSKQIFYAHELA